MTSNRRSLDEIEAELDRNRQQMGHTLDALQHRLSADEIAERARNALHTSGADEFFRNFERCVRRNPLAVSACGVGLTWLMIASSDNARRGIDRYTPGNGESHASHGVGDMAARAGTHTGSAARSVRDGVTHTAESGRETVDQISRGARARASRVSHSAQRGTSRFIERADTMRREQPLMTATLGLALGAVLAASLPRSRSEDRAFGSVRDDVVAGAREAGNEKAGEAQAVAEAAASAAKDAARSEADRHHLHDDGV